MRNCSHNYGHWEISQSAVCTLQTQERQFQYSVWVQRPENLESFTISFSKWNKYQVKVRKRWEETAQLLQWAANSSYHAFFLLRPSMDWITLTHTGEGNLLHWNNAIQKYPHRYILKHCLIWVPCSTLKLTHKIYHHKLQKGLIGSHVWNDQRQGGLDSFYGSLKPSLPVSSPPLQLDFSGS